MLLLVLLLVLSASNPLPPPYCLSYTIYLPPTFTSYLSYDQFLFLLYYIRVPYYLSHYLSTSSSSMLLTVYLSTSYSLHPSHYPTIFLLPSPFYISYYLSPASYLYLYLTTYLTVSNLSSFSLQFPFSYYQSLPSYSLPVLSGDCSQRCTNIHTSKLSSQLMELESRLKAESESRYLRAIVFVETKIAAMKLVQRLKSQFPGLHPEYITGHSLGIGMPLNEQRKIIENFKTGQNEIGNGNVFNTYKCVLIYVQIHVLY
jgi:hypothetical protein